MEDSNSVSLIYKTWLQRPGQLVFKLGPIATEHSMSIKGESGKYFVRKAQNSGWNGGEMVEI